MKQRYFSENIDSEQQSRLAGMPKTSMMQDTQTKDLVFNKNGGAVMPIQEEVYALPSSGKVNGSTALMESLLAEGVDTIFGYPGGAIMPVYDALFDYGDRLKHVLVRHEQGAAHAAEGYSRVTGKVGVCFATSGPGATNLVTGIADAMSDSVPLVCITGQVMGSLLGSDAFQECDVIGVTIPITKWNYLVRDPAEIPSVIRKAFSIAKNGRPGPVLIDIAKDAQINSFNWEDVSFDQMYELHTPRRAAPELLQQAADLINASETPMILVGHGVLISRAEQELLQLAEKTEIPMACTLLGLSACPADHPLYMGMLGMHGSYASNLLTNKADLLIAVGMRFDDRVTSNLEHYAKQAKIIHIDIDQVEIGKNIRPDVAVVADARQALGKLIPLVAERSRPDWIGEFKRLNDIEYERVIKDAMHPSSPTLKMSEVVHILSERTQGEATIVSDVGQHQMMAARYYRFKHPNSFITSGGLGTMGFSLPAAVGAKFGDPTRKVIVIVGDGGFQMTIQELGTIVQEKLPIKIIILNNGFLGMVRQWQELFFDKRYSFVHMKNPDYVKICEGFGIPAERVLERGSLDRAIANLLDAKGPHCLEIVVEAEQNVFPMIPAGAAVDQVRLD